MSQDTVDYKNYIEKMKIIDLINSNEKTAFSFEILPPLKGTGIEKLYTTIDTLKEFVIKQTEPDKFVFEMVSDEDISERDREQIRKKMDEYLEPGLIAEFKRVEKIQRTKAGKMKQFYSYVEKD